MSTTSITTQEFRERRDRLLGELRQSANAVGVVFAGDSSAHGSPRADPNFQYLSGIRDEPGAAILFDPQNPDPKRRCVLFLKPLSPEVEAWDGYRDPIGESLRVRHGFATVLRTTHLPRMLTQAIRMTKRAACLHPFATYDAPNSPDLAAFRKVMERVPGVTIDDRTELLPSMRAIKSSAELAIMSQAIEITAKGYAAAIGLIRPGLRECDVQRAMERAWQDLGASGAAYESIVGTGLNSTVLHYRAGDAVVQDGDLVCIDAGCSFENYAADITRTYPANGVFSPRQRELYDLVLRAQDAAIKAVKPGAWLHEIDDAARAVIRPSGLEDKYPHGIGHQLGLEVHDASPTRALEEGMVVTIEPGLYLAEERIGIRIEDDVLVTKAGARVLSAMIEKDPQRIEAAMAQGRGRG